MLKLAAPWLPLLIPMNLSHGNRSIQRLSLLVMSIHLQKSRRCLIIVCTSANAVEITNSIPADKEILFLPDMFLGSYVARQTNRKNMHIWPGECHVNAGITFRDINKYLDSESDAELLIHPECGCYVGTLSLWGR